jgi:hypothetical protein
MNTEKSNLSRNQKHIIKTLLIISKLALPEMRYIAKVQVCHAKISKPVKL